MNAGWILLGLATLWLALFGAMPGRATDAPSAVLPHGRLIIAPGATGG